MTAPAPTSATDRLPPFSRVWLSSVIAACAYFVAIALPLYVLHVRGRGLAVWPATAVGVVALLLTAPRARPWMALACAIANGTALALFSPRGPQVWAALVAIHVLEEWGLVLLLERTIGARIDFSRTRHLVLFTVWTGLLWTPLIALAGALIYAPTNPGGYAREWLEWWLPDAIWLLLLVPAFWSVAHGRRAFRAITARQWIERATLFAVLALTVSWLLFSRAGDVRPPIGMVLMPLLVFAAMRLGVGSTAWAVVILAFLSVAATSLGFGPFAQTPVAPFTQLLFAQLYCLGVGGSVILLAASIAERSAAAARLRAFFTSAPGLVQVVDTDRRLVAVTSEQGALHERIAGVPIPIWADPVFEVEGVPPSLTVQRTEGWTEALEGRSRAVTLDLGEHGRFEVLYQPLRDATGAVVGAASISADITQREAQDALRLRERKFEALGKLAGGVAHDFNNVLQTLTMRTAILADEREGDPVVAEAAAMIMTSASRLTALTKQLATFARSQVIQPQVIDVPAHLAALERLLVPALGGRVQLTIAPPHEPWPIYVDPSQLDQVMLNLAYNAKDAMPNGGRVHIAVANTYVLGVDAQRLLVEPGEFVRITVTDSGTGIPADVLPRIFEPFFSTKGNKGTFFGLATVHGIVYQANGCIDVRSAVGAGTTFEIFFPRAPADLVAAAPPEREPAIPTHAREARRQGSILLVEDDSEVRRGLVALLSRSEFQVVEARGADEALLLLRRGVERVDLVVSDIVMPGMTGAELARALREERPELPVLLITGFTTDPLVTSAESRDGVRILAKPFSAPQLLANIDALLRRRADH
ncbi:MAG: response regulator [Gemmatimonadaceae bacterium]|nr:response regulator [Gemmatimonadaceae bacterium]